MEWGRPGAVAFTWEISLEHFHDMSWNSVLLPEKKKKSNTPCDSISKTGVFVLLLIEKGQFFVEVQNNGIQTYSWACH